MAIPVLMLNSHVVFSHRPTAGVSVGALSTGTQLFVAFALVNDGTSRSGIVRGDCRDVFSRATARAIINGRIAAAQADVASGKSFWRVANDRIENLMILETTIAARRFIADYRRIFKPTLDESDEYLSDIIDFGDMGKARVRPMATGIIGRLKTLAREVVAKCES